MSLNVSVSGVGSSLSQLPAAREAERVMLMLKKQQDTVKIQAQAIIQLIDAASPRQMGGRVNGYA